MQTCRYGVSYVLAFYVHFLVFFSCFAGEKMFLDGFLVVFTVVRPLVWLLDPPFCQACQDTHHVYVGYNTEKFALPVLHLTVLVRVTVLVL